MFNIKRISRTFFLFSLRYFSKLCEHFYLRFFVVPTVKLLDFQNQFDRKGFITHLSLEQFGLLFDLCVNRMDRLNCLRQHDLTFRNLYEVSDMIPSDEEIKLAFEYAASDLKSIE
jgi:hypothetical protein